MCGPNVIVAVLFRSNCLISDALCCSTLLCTLGAVGGVESFPAILPLPSVQMGGVAANITIITFQTAARVKRSVNLKAASNEHTVGRDAVGMTGPVTQNAHLRWPEP
jgi:hypothetical protein